MRILSIGLLAVCVLTISAADTVAQPYVSGTYAICDINGQERADTIVEEVAAPILDAQVADGTITAWGWLAHHSGGQWRRVLYTIGNDLGDLDIARDRFIEKLQVHSSAAREFSSICSRHDDYVWARVTGSAAAAELGRERPSAGLSVYLECDASKGARVDELMATLGATATRMKDAGKIRSWAFLRHVFGGKYSRLFLIEGDSHAANLEAIDELSGLLATEQPKAFTELREICDSHQDYMWDIKISRP